ncbi:hypothetical protein ES708_08584 [subsurface metagenome]
MENDTEPIEGGGWTAFDKELQARIAPEISCMPNEGMTIRQAAKIKGLHPGTLRRHVWAGNIPYKLTAVNGQLEYRIFAKNCH